LTFVTQPGTEVESKKRNEGVVGGEVWVVVVVVVVVKVGWG
jgi:hypothetical protein